MTTVFDDLMTGLDEVDTFLAGATPGYKVTVPADVEASARAFLTVIARNPQAVISTLHPDIQTRSAHRRSFKSKS